MQIRDTMAFVMFVCILALYTVCIGAEMLDMTYSFDENAKHWPGGQSDFRLTMILKGPQPGGFWMQNDDMTSGIHVGTHMDAPRHFNEHGWTIEQIPVDRLVARPAVMIDIRQKAAQSADVKITLDDVTEYEQTHGEIPRGAVIVQCSGWGDRYADEVAYMGNDVGDITRYHFPGFGVEAVSWLIENRGIYGLAVDGPSIDYGMAVNFPTHVAYSAHNVYSLENVKDTCKLPPAGASIHVLPTKIVEASGGHTRVVAYWGDSINGANAAGATVIAWSLVLPIIALTGVINY